MPHKKQNSNSENAPQKVSLDDLMRELGLAKEAKLTEQIQIEKLHSSLMWTRRRGKDYIEVKWDVDIEGMRMVLLTIGTSSIVTLFFWLLIRIAA